MGFISIISHTSKFLYLPNPMIVSTSYTPFLGLFILLIPISVLDKLSWISNTTPSTYSHPYTPLLGIILVSFHFLSVCQYEQNPPFSVGVP